MLLYVKFYVDVLVICLLSVTWICDHFGGNVSIFCFSLTIYAKFTGAAEKCLTEYGMDRPTMGDVLWNLEYSLKMQKSWLQEHGDAAATPSSPYIVVLTPDEDVPACAVVTEPAPLTAVADIILPSTIEEGRALGEDKPSKSTRELPCSRNLQLLTVARCHEILRCKIYFMYFYYGFNSTCRV